MSATGSRWILRGRPTQAVRYDCAPLLNFDRGADERFAALNKAQKRFGPIGLARLFNQLNRLGILTLIV